MARDLSRAAMIKLAAMMCLASDHADNAIAALAEADLNQPGALPAMTFGANSQGLGLFFVVANGLVAMLAPRMKEQGGWDADQLVETLDAALPSARLNENQLAGEGAEALGFAALEALGRVDPRFADRARDGYGLQMFVRALFGGLAEATADRPDLIVAVCRELGAAAPEGAAEAQQQRNAISKLRRALTQVRNKGDAQAIFDLLMKLGTELMRLANKDEALAAFEEARRLVDVNLAASPGSAPLRQLRVLTLMRTGEVKLANAEPVAALGPLQEGTAILRELAGQDRANAGLQRDLALALDLTGRAHAAAGERQSALAYFKDCAETLTALVATQPGDAALALALCGTREHIGSLLLASGQQRLGYAELEAARRVREELAARHPDDLWLQGERVRGQEVLGDAAMRPRDHAGALAHFHAALDALTQGRMAELGDAVSRQRIAVLHDKAGDAQMALGNPQEAMRHYRASLEALRALGAGQSADFGKRRNFALAHGRVGRAAAQLGQQKEALDSFREGRRMIETLMNAAPGSAQLKGDLEWLDANLKLTGASQADAVRAG